MTELIRPGDRFRHFKGNNYQIIALAKDSETGEEMVVYQGLYGDFETYVRPLSMFCSEVDKAKYPDATQRMRFERIERGTSAGTMSLQTAPATAAPVRQQATPVTAAPVMQEQPTSAPAETGASPERAVFDKTAVDRMMEFFDADDFEEKYKILKAMRMCNDLTDNIIDNMASTIDIVIEDGAVEDRLSQLIKCVGTRRKYETSRLR